MAPKPPLLPTGPLDEGRYARYMDTFEGLKNRFPVHIHTTEVPGAIEQGDIFLFNHFTRWETAVPPHTIFRQTGAIVRSIGHYRLFEIHPWLSTHLLQMGCVPSNMEGLLPFMAKEILRGRKVVIYPEGGMVKDRKVMDAKGNYSIFSHSQGEQRLHHKGAAALAVTLDIIKHHLRTLLANDDKLALASWLKELELTESQLQLVVEKPTLIVPGTITYYPLRAEPNFLVRAIAKVAGQLPEEALEELIIESNMFLHRTDLYLHFNAPFRALEDISWSDKLLINRTLAKVAGVGELFAHHETAPGWAGAYYKRFLEKHTAATRTEYARRLYEGTAINLNHLAAVLISIYAAEETFVVDRTEFHTTLYLALKALQNESSVNLHCSVTRPSIYTGLLQGSSPALDSFLLAVIKAKLMEVDEYVYAFSPTVLTRVHGRDAIRLENPVQLHANEAEPVTKVKTTLLAARKLAKKVAEKDLATMLFHDELLDFDGQRERFTKVAAHTLFTPPAPASGKPYLLLPPKRAKVGVLMVHGFAALPSELRGLADNLHANGYAVLGLRLPGHGTSPLDLEGRSVYEWLEAVRTNHRILAAHVDKTIIVGFSTGGALALEFAAEKPLKLAGVVAAAVPVEVQDRNMKLLPLLMPIRSVLRHIPGLRGLGRFYPFGRKSKGTNYSYVPVAGLNMLRLVTKALPFALPGVKVPVLILQGLADKTVQPRSAQIIYDSLGTESKELYWLKDAPHALVRDNIGISWKEIKKFIRSAGGLA